MPTAKEPSIPEEIERCLAGESKQTAQVLFAACNLLMWIDTSSRRVSSLVTTALIVALVIKDVGFLPAFFAIFACSILVQMTTKNRLVSRYRESVRTAISTIRCVMNEGGASSVADWLERRDRNVGKIIRQVASK